MYGGLKKSASRLALVAAAGALSTNAFAADLGGDCCADLEERVAELEATTARKGTRKTSLEIWGQVNKAVVGWNDGKDHAIFMGEDNSNSSTRFGLRGNAKIAPNVTAGYSIIIDQETGARTYGIGQFTPNNYLSNAPNRATGTYGQYSGQGTLLGTATDSLPGIRDANWWIEDKGIGRLTVGRYDSHNSSLQFNIDLAGIATTVGGGTQSFNTASSLVFRTGNATGKTAIAATNTTNSYASGTNSPLQTGGAGYGNYSNYNLLNVTENAEGSPRVNGLYYTSPTFMGFTVAGGVGGVADSSNPCSNPNASVAGSTCTDDFNMGLFWSAVLKYAAEFNGFRVAAAIAHEDARETNTNSMVSTLGDSYRPNSKDTGFSLSLLHVPSGLFAQGYYNMYTRGHDTFDGTGSGALTVYGAGTCVAGAGCYKSSDTARELLVQVGITKNWFGIGNTVPFAQYGRTTNGYNTFGIENNNTTVSNGAGSVAGTPNSVAYFGDNTTATMWGVGIVQNIDAAAMTLYANYSNFGLTSANCAAAGGCSNIQSFLTGALIKF